MGLSRLGQGAWANYDFKPGDRILLADDFSKDEVGDDFPRRIEFCSGQMEIFEWNEGRWLRSAQGKFFIPLPETLPERFTMEFDLMGNGDAMLPSFEDKEHESAARMEFGEYFGRLRDGEIDTEGEFNTGVKTDGQVVHVAISVEGEARSDMERFYRT